MYIACSVLPNERIIRMMVDDTFRHLEVSHLLKAVQAEDLFLQNTFFHLVVVGHEADIGKLSCIYVGISI